jgi:hypothetical protein
MPDENDRPIAALLCFRRKVGLTPAKYRKRFRSLRHALGTREHVVEAEPMRVAAFSRG